MNTAILHADLDTFFVAVERLSNSQLIGKPVLVGGNSDRSVVASCSYEARQFGIHSAMPMHLAKRLCPEAIIVRGDMDAYSKYSDIITEILESKAPIVEKASIDEHYMDMTGMDRFIGTWKFTQELRQFIIKETGLPISFGLSSNKTVSKIATGEAKPSGEKQIAKDLEKAFLAPLSIKKIPGVGPKTYQLLRNMGLEQIATLQSMEVRAMQHLLGENGVQIWNKANAIDPSPVLPFREQKSMSKEITFEQDTIDIHLLEKTLKNMVEVLCFDLRQEGKLTASVSVKIRYSNFDTHSKQSKIAFTASDKLIEEKVLTLFRKLHQRRMLIRLIGVKLSKLIYGAYQADLFNDTAKELQLIQTIDEIRKRYGFESLKRAYIMD